MSILPSDSYNLLGYPIRSDKFMILPTEPTCITIPAEDADLSMPYPRTYHRVKTFAQDALDTILARRKSYPEEPAAQAITKAGTAQRACDALVEQLNAFWYGHTPFNTPLRPNESPLEWWMSLEHNRNADILAVRASYLVHLSPFLHNLILLSFVHSLFLSRSSLCFPILCRMNGQGRSSLGSTPHYEATSMHRR